MGEGDRPQERPTSELTALRQRVTELETLQRTSLLLTSSLDLPSVLDSIVEGALALVGASDCIIYLYDGESERFSSVTASGKWTAEGNVRPPRREGMTATVAREGQPVVINDAVNHPLYASRDAQRWNIQAIAGFPLQRANQLLGVLHVVFDEPHTFSEDELRVLGLLADQAAVAIDHSQLYAQAQQETAERVQAEEELRKHQAHLEDLVNRRTAALRESNVQLLREVAERERADQELRQYQEHLEELVKVRTADLQQSEERYRTLFEGVPLGLYRTTPAGQIVDANLALVQMLGHPSREALLAVSAVDLYVNPEDRLLLTERVEREGVLRDFEAQLRRYDGEIIWTNLTLRAVRDEQGQVLHYEGSLEDITERKHAEQELHKHQEHLEELVQERTAELQESEERYRTLFDGVPVGLYRTRPEGQIVDANSAFVQMSGFPSKEELLKVDADAFYVTPQGRARWKALMDREGIVRDFEHQICRYDGTAIWINETARAVRDEQGQVLYYEGSTEDVTERKRLERESRRQKDYFEALFVNSPVAVVSVDMDANVVAWNPAAEELFGYTQKEAIGRDIDSLVANDDSIRAEGTKYTAQLLTLGLERVQATTRRSRKDGSLVDVEMLGVPAIVADQLVGFIVIYYDISELEQARKAAETANQAKSIFLANMSHELRTPLNAIIGFTRLVKRRCKDILPQKHADNLDKVLISADYLLELINSVLDLSKIEAGRIDVQTETFELETLVDVCLETVQPLIKDQELRLVKQIQPRLPILSTDQEKLRQILINLLSNAVKFTEEGTITVSARCADGTLELTVADTGIGIPEEALERVFVQFQQVDNSTTRRYGGTGLGLSITRHLARLLRGDVTVESTVGVGSTFTVSLPFCYATPEPVPPTPTPSEASPEKGEAQPEEGPLVLVIDDDPNVISLLREDLADAGYRVVGAANGEEGLEKARSIEPFAIILDIMMSPKDGWQVLHELKTDANTRPIPVVVVSIVDNKELGYRLGAFDYLVKPFDRDAILGTLARMAPAQQPPRPIRLLVVDDDPEVVNIVRHLLGDDPYEVQSASDGQEALQVVAQQCPDIILLDLMMPRLDGFGVIEELEQLPSCRDIPIVVLTAKALTSGELAGLQQRVSNVVEKRALRHDVLAQELRSALQAYRQDKVSQR